MPEEQSVAEPVKPASEPTKPVSVKKPSSKVFWIILAVAVVVIAVLIIWIYTAGTKSVASQRVYTPPPPPTRSTQVKGVQQTNPTAVPSAPTR